MEPLQLNASQNASLPEGNEFYEDDFQTFHDQALMSPNKSEMNTDGLLRPPKLSMQAEQRKLEGFIPQNEKHIIEQTEFIEKTNVTGGKVNEDNKNEIVGVSHSNILRSNRLKEKIRSSQEDRESKIKDTINEITKKIMLSKQEIVGDISSITKYYQENQKQIKDRLGAHQSNIFELKKVDKKDGQVKILKKSSNPSLVNKQNKNQVASISAERNIKKSSEPKKQLPNQGNINKKNLMQLQKRKDQVNEEKKRKKEIYNQRMLAKKKIEKVQKIKEKQLDMEIKKRLAYEHRFNSRQSVSPVIPISQEDIRIFEDAFILHIKQRLNIGKVREKKQQKIHQPHLHEMRKKSVDRMLNKGEKLIKKAAMNLKQKIQEELEHTYESILANSNQFEDNNQVPINRGHQSAPNLKLPKLTQEKLMRRTAQYRDKLSPVKVLKR